MKPLGRTIAILVLVLRCSVVLAQPQFYDPQPAGKISTLFGEGDEAITDIEFADMARNLLTKANGTTNARGAMFLFGQSFGGGMFNELEDALGNDLRWVGGSASRHDGPSYGFVNPPLETWVHALDQEFNAFSPMIYKVNQARFEDVAGPNGGGEESPQTIYRNGGENILHDSLAASSHNAVLWAGAANEDRFSNDVRVMYDNLKHDFQATGDPWSIIVLGDVFDPSISSIPATKANLASVFQQLELIQDPNADFLFFATGLGGTDTIVLDDALAIGDGESIVRRISLLDSELDGIFNTIDPLPGVLLKFTDLRRPGVRVFIEDVELPDPLDRVDPTGEAFLPIDLDALRKIGSTFQIRVLNETGDRLLIESAFVRSGGVAGVVVPELSSICFGIAGLVVVGAFFCRRRITPA